MSEPAPLIAVFEAPRAHAEAVAAALRAHGIKVAVFGGLESTQEGYGGARVMVRAEDARAALDIIGDES